MDNQIELYDITKIIKNKDKKIILNPYKKEFIINDEELIGQGKTSLINKFIMNDKEYIIKYFNLNKINNYFKEFTYLNFNNLSYKCYGYTNNNHILYTNLKYNNISIYDYIKGKKLINYLIKHKDKILIIFNKINDYIDYLHKNYILHNDLIISNIMITKNKDNDDININIIDYGESICYYNNKYISNYYINDKILNEYTILDRLYKNNYVIDNLNEYCYQYLNYIDCIDKYMIFSNIIIKQYMRYKDIRMKRRIKNARKLFLRIFKKFNNKEEIKKDMTDKLFKYFINHILTNRLNIPLYTFILFKNNKLTNQTLKQLINIYNVIMNDINIYDINNFEENIKFFDEVLNIINKEDYNLLYSLNDLDIIILCIIHYTLNIYIQNINNDTLLYYFTYPNIKYYKSINYVNNLTNSQFQYKNKDINFDLFLFDNLLLI